MNRNGLTRFFALTLLAALLLGLLAGCTSEEGKITETTTAPSQTDEPNDNNEILAFRPVDCGVQSLEVYEYPFLGLTLKLSEALLAKIDSREVFVFTQEDYTADGKISYALLRFSATTQEEREQEVMSLDLWGWEAALGKVGAIGVYEKDAVSRLDELTACDTHEKIGESADGAYEYYLSTNSAADASVAAELKAADVTIGEMHEIDLSMGYSAFSADRIEGLENVGIFSAEDIFGNAYTEAVFGEYDLTLVNCFATWCSPCVNEMPELEKLRKEYADKGIRLGVIAVVLDAKTSNGVDENAVELAKTLSQKCGANFPFLIPDATDMNGRLTGIEAVPESFFVDSDGNIVSEPYVGANSLEGWRQVVDAEFAELQGAS